MERQTKIQLAVIAYCAFLWFTNWRVSTSYDRDIGLTNTELDLRVLGFLFGGIATIVYTRRLWKLTRDLLSLGARIPKEQRIIGQLHLLWLLTPLAFGFDNHWATVAGDGAIAETVFEYGGDLSVLSIILSASAIMLFQTIINLESFHPDAGHNKTMNRSREAVAFGL